MTASTIKFQMNLTIISYTIFQEKFILGNGIRVNLILMDLNKDSGIITNPTNIFMKDSFPSTINMEKELLLMQMAKFMRENGTKERNRAMVF